MPVIIQFNSKSKAKNIPEAIKIAKKLKGELDGDFYRIEFDSLEDKDLVSLYKLVGGLKQSKLIADSMVRTNLKGPSKPESKLNWLYNEKLLTSEKSYEHQDIINDMFETAKKLVKTDYMKAIEAFIGIIEVDHKDGYYFSESLSYIGRLYYIQNKHQEAFEVFDKFFVLYPNWDITGDIGEFYLDSCKQSGNTQRYKEIQKLIEEKSKLKTEKIESHHHKKLDLNNLEQVNAIFHKRIDIKYKNFDFWINLGQAFKNFGQNKNENSYYEKAINCYKKAVEVQPRDFDVLLNIGTLYEIIGKMDEALEYFKLIMNERDQEQIEHHNNIIKLNLDAIESWIAMGDIFSDYDIYLRAIDCYQMAIELNPEKPSIWISMGKTYLNAEEFPEALECFKKVLKLKPESRIIRTIINKIDSNKIGDALEILWEL